MTTKAELHELVDELDDRATDAALVCLRRTAGDGALDAADPHGLDDDESDGPMLVSGADFFNAPDKTWQELAAEQGKGPVRFEDLLGPKGFDWGPESVDEMVATIRAWRREGNGG